MRNKTRRIVTTISLLLFPITLNFFSPYLSIDGAMAGIISGSVIVFLIMFLTGLIFGRGWCAWVCPMASLSDVSETINKRNPNVRKLTIIRYSIFALWFGVLMIGFILAGGIKGIDPLYMMDSLISVDEPLKYIVYYFVLFLYFILSITIGKRGACHSICWMSPFLVAGFEVSRFLKIPHLRILSKQENCISCGKCDKVCPMSIHVKDEALNGGIMASDCILCGQCVDVCPKNVLKYLFTTKKK